MTGVRSKFIFFLPSLKIESAVKKGKMSGVPRFLIYNFWMAKQIQERGAASILKFDPNNCVRMDLWLSNCGSQLSIVGLADII